MKKKKVVKNKVSFSFAIILISLFLFGAIIYRGYTLAMSKEIDGINIQDFAKNRTTRTVTLTAKRGNIYDANGNTLAENVYSYTLIAYLSSSRTTNKDRPKHVVDKEETAEKLSEVLDCSYDYIYSQLIKENLYQTEFGKCGKGLTELDKSKIEALKLPGLDFISSQKRYYANGNYLSYTLGYAKSSSEGEISGEMGIEKQYNELLSGKDGYITYQKDNNGYQIAGTDVIEEPAQDGSSIYLTIDGTIQLFVEQAIKEAKEKYEFESMTIMIGDAHTGAILASSSYPSFDPNTREGIKSYLDPNVSVGIEPGSTMKIFTYMATMENGNYDGNKTYKSGLYKAKDGTEIGDWDRSGWGVISYDRGFALSSNVGAANLATKFINRQILGNYFRNLGFGNKTGIELPNETSGKLDFTYETEVVNASFGQGILTTPVQNIKALTAIANDGILLQPYIISKIVDENTKEITYEGEKNELGRIASIDTVNKIKDLMEDVINEGTGTPYKIEGYDLICKTGTAQIPSTNGKGYLGGKYEVIRGFAGIYPKDNPKVVIYATMTRPHSANPLAYIVDDVVINLTKYYGIDTKVEDTSKDNVKSFILSNYVNDTVDSTKEKLKEYGVTPIVIGSGNKVINQYPSSGTSVTSKERVVLFTNNTSTYKMPNVVGWSYKDIASFSNIVGLSTTYEGTGYVTEQSIKEGTIIKKNDKLNIKLKIKYK